MQFPADQIAFCAVLGCAGGGVRIHGGQRAVLSRLGCADVGVLLKLSHLGNHLGRAGSIGDSQSRHGMRLAIPTEEQGALGREPNRAGDRPVVG